MLVEADMNNGVVVMRRFEGLGFWAALCVLVWIAMPASASAKTPSSDIDLPAATRQVAQGTEGSELPLPKRKPFVIEGFRSAKFGMDERAVRRAIVKDLKVSARDINRQIMGEGGRRRVLLATQVDDLLPDSGMVEVIYVLTLDGKALREVHLHWGDPVDDKTKPEQLVALANSLRSYFEEQGYQPETIIRNQRGEDGQFLVFNGMDVTGRTTRLLLGVLPKDADQVKREWKNFLRLSYFGQPAARTAPAKVKIKEGQF